MPPMANSVDDQWLVLGGASARAARGTAGDRYGASRERQYTCYVKTVIFRIWQVCNTTRARADEVQGVGCSRSGAHSLAVGVDPLPQMSERTPTNEYSGVLRN